jgi:hypothetical protein
MKRSEMINKMCEDLLIDSGGGFNFNFNLFKVEAEALLTRLESLGMIFKHHDMAKYLEIVDDFGWEPEDEEK